jgi:hypothetical protein
MANNIIGIRVVKTWETCERTTYYIELRTDEGFTMTPSSHRTRSIYTDFVGLTKDEARDRALIDANTWADFLGLTVDAYVEDGVERQPSMHFETYTTRRKLAARKDTTHDQ